MEYDCHIVLASKVYSDFNKIIRPLCSSCTNHSCTNPVAEKKISVFGKIYTGRFFFNGNAYFMVQSCEGYRGNVEEDSEFDNYEDDGDFG
jgi:hypothetical protein